jgi:hypothetical protein
MKMNHRFSVIFHLYELMYYSNLTLYFAINKINCNIYMLTDRWGAHTYGKLMKIYFNYIVFFYVFSGKPF